MLPIRKDVSLLDYSQFLELPSTCSGTAALQRLPLLAAASRLIGLRSITAIRALMLATAQRLVLGEQRTMAADRSLHVRSHLVRAGACDPLQSFAGYRPRSALQRLLPAMTE